MYFTTHNIYEHENDIYECSLLGSKLTGNRRSTEDRNQTFTAGILFSEIFYEAYDLHHFLPNVLHVHCGSEVY